MHKWNETQQVLLEALTMVLKGERVQLGLLNEDVLREATHQSVVSLISTDMRALKFVKFNVQLMWEQQQIEKVLENIPYVVIKGACAAIYYPEPLRRAMGDIDILVCPEDFGKSYDAMKTAGYNTADARNGEERHAHFIKNSNTKELIVDRLSVTPFRTGEEENSSAQSGKPLVVELHRNFATLQTKKQERLLDEWLYAAIKGNSVMGRLGKYTFPMLDDQINGIVLLAHINQHLEEGLGLRHIVDWVMYVKHSLSDENWIAFKQRTDLLGLTTLAKVIAKLGQKYLGLSHDIKWCQDASDETVDALLAYAFECGNFGKKDVANNTVIMIMSHGRGIKGFFRNLQRRGEVNWQLLQQRRFTWLRPFAWIFQLVRYIRLGMRDSGIKDVGKNIKSSARRNKLLDDLEATRFAMKE